MYDESNIEWDDTCYSLKELLKNFTLPQLVMVDEGYMLNETESLSSGQLITVQSHDNVTQFKGTDSEGKNVTLPVKCPFHVKLVAKEESRIYRGVKELCQATERPKYVEVKSSRGKRDLGLVKIGDRLKILLTERGPNGPTYLHFRNQRGKHLRLPVEFSCDFRGCAEDDNEHLLTDLLGKDLPLYIKFVDSRRIGDAIGIIELNECTSDTVVYASTNHRGRLFATAFPLSLDVKVRAMNEAPKAKASNDRVRDSVIETIDIDKFREFMARDKSIHENGYVYFAPLDLIKDQNKSVAEAAKTTEPERIRPVVVNEYEEPVNNVNSAKRKSQGFLSRVKLKLRGSKSSNRKSQEMRPEIVIMDRQCGALSDGGDSGIYEQIPADTYVSMDVIDGARRAFRSPKKSVVRKRTLTKAQSSAVPPPLPGNHPLERRHTYNAKVRNATEHKMKASSLRESNSERDNFKKFYENMKKSEQQILNCDLDGVAGILRELKLEEYINKFLDNQIDGKLLVDLDEAVFKDIGLTPFEARKLRKYVFGWRPDETKTNENYSSDYADKSEALKWSENEVADHLANLGLDDFCRFCRMNQVNGDLLWDMVVDEEIIYGLLTGSDRRLNAVKLKNYVTEGWRPKLSKKRSNSVNTGTLEKRTSKVKGIAEDEINSSSSSKQPRQKAAPLGKNSLISAARRHSASLSTDAMSPASSSSDRQSSNGSSRSVSRSQSRLQAKVSYPKNSPYARSDTATKPDDMSMTTAVIKPVKTVSGTRTRLQEVEQVTVAVGGSKSMPGKNTKTQSTTNSSCKATSDDKTRQATTTGRKIPHTGTKLGTDARKIGVSAVVVKKQQAEAKAGCPSDSPREAGLAKQKKVQKTFSLRRKNSAKSEIKSSTQKDTGKSGKNEAISVSSSAVQSTSNDKHKPKDKKSDSSNESKSKLVTKSSTTAAAVRQQASLGETEKPALKRREAIDKAEPEAVQSPSIANLRKQYESKEEPTFRKGDQLRRSGKNELRMAIKRKESSGKQDARDIEQAKPISSVAHLKKQFDSKPIL